VVGNGRMEGRWHCSYHMELVVNIQGGSCRILPQSVLAILDANVSECIITFWTLLRYLY
jgi:hypothetical protein